MPKEISKKEREITLDVVKNNEIRSQKEFITKYEAECTDMDVECTVTSQAAVAKRFKSLNIKKSKDGIYRQLEKRTMLDTLLKKYCLNYAIMSDYFYAVILKTDYADEGILAATIDVEYGEDILHISMGIRSVFILFKQKKGYTHLCARLKKCGIEGTNFYKDSLFTKLMKSQEESINEENPDDK